MTRLAIIAALILSALALAACGTHDPAQPTIITKTVNVPTPVACDPKLGPDPIYPDTAAAIAAAPNVAERARLYAAGRLMRQARERELQAAVVGCSKVPAP